MDCQESRGINITRKKIIQMFDEPIPIKISNQKFRDILQKRQKYYVLDQNIFDKEQNPNKSILTKPVLFYTENSDHGPKPDRQYLGVLRTLSYSQKFGDKYIVNILEFIGYHQDLAWFKDTNSKLVQNLALCASGGYILTKNKDKIETEFTWD